MTPLVLPRILIYEESKFSGKLAPSSRRTVWPGVPLFEHDHLGSTTKVLSSTGAVLATQKYHPYGRTRATTGVNPTDKLFTGHQQEGTGTRELYFAQARFYDPWIGLFTQPDSIVPEPGNPQALNRYAYVYNNPMRYTDPSGYCIVNVGPLNDACDAVGNFFTQTIPGAWDDATSALEQAYLRGQYYLDRFLEDAEAAKDWVTSQSLSFGHRVADTTQDLFNRGQDAVEETVDTAQDVVEATGEGLATAASATGSFAMRFATLNCLDAAIGIAGLTASVIAPPAGATILTAQGAVRQVVAMSVDSASFAASVNINLYQVDRGQGPSSSNLVNGGGAALSFGAFLTSKAQFASPLMQNVNVGAAVLSTLYSGAQCISGAF